MESSLCELKNFLDKTGIANARARVSSKPPPTVAPFADETIDPFPFPGQKNVYSEMQWKQPHDVIPDDTPPTPILPPWIVLPNKYEQVQQVVKFCVFLGLRIAIRSGGHSFDALAPTCFYSRTNVFVNIDLRYLNSVKVDVSTKSAWADAGAKLGEIYQAIGFATDVYGFPAGTCPTVGSGGHIAGGGSGMLVRKYGLASDHIEDVKVVDGKGNLLQKKDMSEDAFWAICGGGGGSWGIVVSWKIKLLKVPSIVTVFTINETNPKHLIDVLWKWQQFIQSDSEYQRNLTVRFSVSNSTEECDFTPKMSLRFYGLYLGSMEDLLKHMDVDFPELGLTAEHCDEMSWYKSTRYFAKSYSKADISDDKYPQQNIWKYMSDIVRTPMSRLGLTRLCAMVWSRPTSQITLLPCGGIMNDIPNDKSPYPHRKDTLYLIYYGFNNPTKEELKKLKFFYELMKDDVSSNPRAAYVNFVDLNLGCTANDSDHATVTEAEKWAGKYFLKNYPRLVKAKMEIDPENIFRNPQSIPPPTSN